MKSVLIAGGSGLVGSRLQDLLGKAGLRTYILTRDKNLCTQDSQYFYWDLRNNLVDPALPCPDYIVNLAGAGIADKRWTLKRKEAIIKSRTLSTALLIETCESRKFKVEAFVNASAVGYYGDTGDQLIDENSLPSGKDFLSEVCQLWEESAKRAQKIAKSVSILRISTVLSTKGGALPKLTLPLKLGVANYLGSGKQYLSWIHIDDLCQMIIHCLSLRHHMEIFNAASPDPKTNKDFMKSLIEATNAHALLVPVPAMVLKLTMGEMASLLLTSSRLNVEKIQKTGFVFDFGNLPEAIRQLYAR